MTGHLIKFNSETFKLKFATVLSVFLDKYETHAFSELEEKSGINFSDVEKTLKFLGYIIDEKTYKMVKNSYLQKIEMQEEVIHDTDDHLYVISEPIYEKQFLDSYLTVLADRYEQSSVQIAFDFHRDIMSYFYCNLKNRFIHHVKSNYTAFLKKIRREVVTEYFERHLDKQDKYREISQIEKKNDRMEKICSIVYNEINISRQVFEANMNYQIDWGYYYSQLVKHVEEKAQEDAFKNVQEILSKYPKEKQKEVKTEIKKRYLEIMNNSFSKFQKDFTEYMKEYEAISQIQEKYLKLFPNYKESSESLNLECEEMQMLIEAGMKEDFKIKII